MGTLFTAVYNRFLGKITDDLYLELTPEDTLKDLQNLLINALPGFEFPRQNLYEYEIKVEVLDEDEVLEDDFVIAISWGELEDSLSTPKVFVDRSRFSAELTPEEINILAILMKEGWLQRQVTSIEHTRMKYSGPDFKMTSQANHLQKLLTTLAEGRRDSLHMQRLYKRRKVGDNGAYQSNWSSLRSNSAID